MSGRKPLRRVEQVYGLVERIHSIELQQAAGLVQEAELAVDGQRVEMQQGTKVSRSAMLAGDREEWFVASIQRELGAKRWQELELVRGERQRLQEVAREVYGASRMKTEQVKSVRERTEAAERLVEGRRTQNATDDRYLSRLRWTQLRNDLG